MTISRAEFKEHLRSFNFHELFLSLGWDNVKYQNKLKIDDTNYNLKGIVQKRGFLILTCVSESDFPDTNTRKKIERQVSKLFYEHLIIYHDNKTKQIWQLSRKLPNKPIQVREFTYYNHQEPEFLYQKVGGLLFTLDEEDKLSLVDVKQRISEEFNQNAEKVTKKFYQDFKKEHSAFQNFIEGLEDKSDIDWYTSLMLNRLMFIYFIQKKGFLDSNPNYLSEKLKTSIEKKGKDKFYKSFYRSFLLTLFHKGLGNPQHDKKLLEEIGKVPYLNGGLFDVHELEKDNEKLDIKDKAFERLFKFFDEFNWHLDTSINATGRDINPDVIGYIFEKYINDRASMGAYYTKEDITEYISKNTIIPFLFDKAKKECANAFKDESSLWQMLKDNPDKYIYDAVKHGIYENQSRDTPFSSQEKGDGGMSSNLKIRELPQEISRGINPEIQKRIVKDVQNNPPQLLELRKDWNKPAPPEYGLPTEIWREVVERRERYFEIKKKIENGEIREINDFITYNLNITQFAQDAVENYEGSDFINAFYNAIKEVTILDPTCGSGAFLFAALNILEPLYETCIKRMREFVEIDDTAGTGKKHQNFRKVLADVEQHPNEKYYIYKSIILNNLYGVDIMKEAVEIAKLRLFLKLVAEVEPDAEDENYGLEPLPDIDFNIRSGNTLVGYASYKQIEESFESRESNGTLMFSEEKKFLKNVDDTANKVADMFKEFREQQAVNNPDSIEYKETKNKVIKILDILNDDLNKYLAYEYGINSEDLMDQARYKKWLDTHKPFHWFAEFYEIVHQKGGFDVVIGNPPYVEYNSVKKSYLLRNYETLQAGNLYSFVIELSIKIQKVSGYNGMIIPLSAYSTDRMDVLQKYEFMNSQTIWLSNFAERPSKLFSGAERNVTISILRLKSTGTDYNLFTTAYYKWNAEFRDHLFENISFYSANGTSIFGIVPKVSRKEELSLLNKLRNINKNVNFFLSSKTNENTLYYRNSGGRYWKIITDFQPKFLLNGSYSVSSRESYLHFNSKTDKEITVAILNSTLYYWYYINHSDTRTNNPSDLKDFPVDISSLSVDSRHSLISLCSKLMKDLNDNSKQVTINLKTGQAKVQQFFPHKSKNIIDKIDMVLAEHYGFTEEELDFIINYDIKYRMGKELNAGSEEEE